MKRALPSSWNNWRPFARTKLLDCSFIRMFSFLIPKDADADSYTDVVLDKLRQFIRIAEKHDIVLLHENEKGIYGDTGARCKLLFDRLACPHFKAAFDFANFVQCEQDTAECWELLHDQINIYPHQGCSARLPAECARRHRPWQDP